MKLLKKDYIKNLILAVMLIAAIFTNVCAAGEDLENVFSMNFNSASGAGTVVSDGGYMASAEVKDGAATMQSDALIYWRAPENAQYRDEESFNPDSTKAHGIKLNAVSKNQQLSDVKEADKAKYGNTNYFGQVNQYALKVEQIDGLFGAGSIMFHEVKYEAGVPVPQNKYKTTEMYFNIDEKIAANLGSDVTFKIKVYLRGENANPKFYYPNTDGGTSDVRLKFVDPDIPTGQWYEFTKRVTNADLSRRAFAAASGTYSNIKFVRNSTEIDGDAFIHSIEVYPTNAPEFAKTSLTYPVNAAGIARNVNATFDLTIPEEESIVAPCADSELEGSFVCSTADKYNAAGTVMYATILNDSKTEGVKLKYEVGAEGALSVYACTPDGEMLINQDAPMSVGTAYTYAVTVYFETGAYDVEIKQGSDVVASGENYAGLLDGLQFKTAHIRFEQSLAESMGVKAIFDNISVDVPLTQDYKDCRAAANELTLPEVVSENFSVKTFDEDFGTDIEWLVVGGDINAIVIEGDSASVIPTREEQLVFLTAVVTKNGEEYRRDFTVTVTGLEGTATKVTIEYDEAQISGGVASLGKSVVVMAPGASDSVIVTDVKLVIMAIGGTGEINARGEYIEPVNPYDPYGSIEFANVATTSGTAKAGDKIVCYVWDQDNRPINNNAPIVSDFTVSDKASGAVLDWNAYDDYDAVNAFEIYRDNVLIDTMTITAGGDTSKMSSALEPIVTQSVCGSDVAGTSEKMYRYVDRNVEIGAEHSYKIIPKDKNLSRGEDGKILEGQKKEMFYLVPDGTSDPTVNSELNGNGKIALLYNGDPARESYTEDARAKSDFELPGRYLENNRPADMNGDGKITDDEYTGTHYIQFKTKEFTGEKSKEDVVVRLKFKTTGDTTVQFHYNHEIDSSHLVDSTGTYYNNGPTLNVASGNDVFKPGEWIVWELKLLNAEFGTSTTKFGGAHFGLSISGNNVGLYLNKVEAISLSDWE